MDIDLGDVSFCVDFPIKPIIYKLFCNREQSDNFEVDLAEDEFENFRMYVPNDTSVIVGGDVCQMKIQDTFHRVQFALKIDSAVEIVNAMGELVRYYVHCWSIKNIEKSYRKGFFITSKCDFKYELDQKLEEEGFSLLAHGAISKSTLTPCTDMVPMFRESKLMGHIDPSEDGGPSVEVAVFPQVQEAPKSHPVFLRVDNTTIIPDLTTAFLLLEQCPSSLSGINELRSIVQQELQSSYKSKDNTVPHPLIVVEGLDASGKSTAVEKLKENLKARQFQTPPPCLKSLRPIFDAHPPLIRRLYYTFGNYIVSKHITEALQNDVVVMDRFWNSTTAYALAADCSSGDEDMLPPVNSHLYQWPRDLVAPTIVFLLTVTEDTRNKRLYDRIASSGEGQTKEEKELEINHMTRRRTLEAYRRMKNPAPTEVDANVEKELVLEQILNILKEKSIL